MNFLLLLLAVAIEFAIGSAAALRHRRWSEDWARWCDGLFDRYGWWRGWTAAGILLLPPVFACGAAIAMLHAIAPFLGHLAALAVLLMMLGPDDLLEMVEVHKRRREETAAGNELLHVAGPFVLDEEGADDPSRRELAAVAVAAERAWYGPLAWFFCAGAMGALLYRQALNLQRMEIAGGAEVRQCAEALEFLPARITALAFGLVGSLSPVLERVSAHGLLRWGDSASLVALSALAAADDGRIREVIGGDETVYRLNLILALIKRALIVWLVLFGGLNLLGG